jgi:hypothetical protein
MSFYLIVGLTTKTMIACRAMVAKLALTERLSTLRSRTTFRTAAGDPKTGDRPSAECSADPPAHEVFESSLEIAHSLHVPCACRINFAGTDFMSINSH